MNPAALHQAILHKRSFLCVGLDTDVSKIPQHLLSEPEPVLAFHKAIIEATAPYAVAYKPNLAFFEALGRKGWDILAQTLEMIPPGILRIADAKRGDIGNTATLYAQAFFKEMGCEAITVAPYMGQDSVKPFLAFPDTWAFVLALTSNPGAVDFQWYGGPDAPLYREVVRKTQEWAAGMPGHLGYVVGATRPEYLAEIRALAPEAFFLVPGVGAQGGSLTEVIRHGLSAQVGLLVNASRSILYASSGTDFAAAAAAEARRMRDEMDAALRERGL